ncbi:hypothetical protein [Franconibacter helveticus]|uniref:hypothetical protein n=1 Tax=Franconibacter helveticus TaxID=357240 RepID=UPI00066E9AFA|nr:hypothetical protein [Franconibacter helveticus]
MKSADSSLATLFKRIGIQSANLVEALSTGICSIAAFTSFFVLEGWVGKITGLIGFFVLAYLIAWAVDKVKVQA